MEAASLAFSVAQTFFSTLQCKELKKLFSMFGYKDELERLQSTVETIKAVLLDADAKGVLSDQQRDFIEKLKDAVYDADDLFDEFITLAEQQRLLSREGTKLSKKVRRLFSRFEKLCASYKMSKEVKKIRKKLGGIVDDANKYCFRVDYQPIRERREETCSYVNEKSVIGRDEDVNSIISKLLDPNIEEDVSILTIVGIGGLGKTTLAQLVFNDETVKKEFPLRLWACVSDQDPDLLDVVAILGKILKSDETCNGDLGFDYLQKKVRGKLEGNKYLLVLDDVWTENRLAWEKLETLLMGGQRGSRVVVTTRSKDTAETTLRSNVTYELQGLSDENSWRLFESAAGQEQANRHDLVEIGKAIVKKCANVPLAIKVVGSLLYGQGEDKWQSFQHSRITAIRKNKNDIVAILKFSYHHLSPSLKSCFSYCALFPKDFRIEKEMLISLWMAQGFIEEPLGEGQSIEDAAEEHFQILSRRCFFQDLERDTYGEIVSCKIHDLMHDIAQEVAGKEIFEVDSTTRGLNEKVRHVFDVSLNFRESLFTKTRIRSYFSCNKVSALFLLSALVPNFLYLRVLHLGSLGVTTIPDKIGQLLHLRFLDLSGNRDLVILPESIKKLHNLQTLILSGCWKLKELPNDFGKLINLKALDLKGCNKVTYLPADMSKLTRLKALHIEDCNSLTCMPCGMSKLTHLCKLNKFAVPGAESSISRPYAAIEELEPLSNLRGYLAIYFDNRYTYEEKDVKEGYLSNKKHLTRICIAWGSAQGSLSEQEANRSFSQDEALLEDLQPHSNLKELVLEGYRGVKIPKWARQDNLGTYLPNLVMIQLDKCCGLRELPWLGKLRFLKSIYLRNLPSLEYMENTSCSWASAPVGGASGGANSRSSFEAAEVDSLFFPSLEKLELWWLPGLKGWWRGSESGSEVSQPLKLPSFPHLSKVEITNCPNLRLMPLSPKLEHLDIIEGNNILVRLTTDEGTCSSSSSSASQPSMSPLSKSGDQRHHNTMLWMKEVVNVGLVKSLVPVTSNLEMKIDRYKEVESVSEFGEVLRRCSSSLRALTIWNCKKLRRVWGGGGLEYLTALEELTLEDLHVLMLEEEEDDDMPSWRCFAQTLQRLDLLSLRNVKKLPKGMRHLTSLQSLQISNCPLESLPDWIGCLSSLQRLHIGCCNHLTSLPEAMRELTSLRKLELWWCPVESLPDCIGCLSSLQLLEIVNCRHLTSLPTAMRHLTSLQSLQINNCPFESLPDWIGCLSSLRYLYIIHCKHLTSIPESMRELTSLRVLNISSCQHVLQRKCREPDGECWPFIQHIPSLAINH